MIKFITAHPAISCTLPVVIIFALAYYFKVIRWERKQRKKNEEMDAPYFNIKKFREQNKK